MTMSSNFTYEWNDSWAEMIQSHTSISAWNHSGMAIKDNDHIVTSDNGESKIITYNINGKIIDSWTANFTHAHGITLSYDEGFGDVIWIADNGSRREKDIGYQYPPGSELKSGRVFKVDMSGNEIFELPLPLHDSYKTFRYAPTSIAVNEIKSGGNGDIWIADGYGASLIHRYDQHGNHVQSIDGIDGAGKFNCPHGILIDYRSDTPELYVADRVNKRIQVFDLDGNFSRSFGSDFLSTPSGFAILNDNLIIAELKGRLTITDMHDKFVTYLFPNDGAENRPGWPNMKDQTGSIVKNQNLSINKFNSPHEVVTDTKGNIYVTEWLIGGRITKLTVKK